LLGWKVGGSQLSLEKQVNQLAEENKNLEAIVDALIKSTVVMIDGVRLFDGPTPGHIELLGKIMGRVVPLATPGIVDQAIADLEKAKSDANAADHAAAKAPQSIQEIMGKV
jgi:outer membrane murein-binding lipoprotein Lpp